MTWRSGGASGVSMAALSAPRRRAGRWRRDGRARWRAAASEAAASGASPPARRWRVSRPRAMVAAGEPDHRPEGGDVVDAHDGRGRLVEVEQARDAGDAGLAAARSRRTSQSQSDRHAGALEALRRRPGVRARWLEMPSAPPIMPMRRCPRSSRCSTREAGGEACRRSRRSRTRDRPPRARPWTTGMPAETRVVERRRGGAAGGRDQQAVGGGTRAAW